jgi:TetR/AcrR family transcriptional regulator, transcriptional repressor for nem operon
MPSAETPPNREETKLRTRAALVDAGIALFGEQGLDAPSLDAICERAGFTRGAFYVHFRDRDAFLEAVMERLGQQFLDAVLEEPEPTSKSKPGTGLTRTMARFVGAVAAGEYPLMREGGVRPHQLLDACARSPAIRAQYVRLAEQSVSRLAQIVRADQKAGTLRDDVDDRSVATLLLAAIIGAQTMNELRMKLDLARTARGLLRMLAPPK